MINSIYKATLLRVLTAIDEYKSKNISLESYQTEVFKAENEIVSFEEKKLRLLMQNHENKVELIKYTTGDAESIFTEVDKFREKISYWL